MTLAIFNELLLYFQCQATYRLLHLYFTTGQFVIEYVGEVIDDEEYQRRLQIKHEDKDENYYFLTIDSTRMIDAGPKGNVSR